MSDFNIVPSDSEPSTFLAVEPKSFQIILKKNKQEILELALRNLTQQWVCFKVKTTAPERYLVSPTMDVVAPGATKQCKIVLNAIQDFSPFFGAKDTVDKFLVQSYACEEKPEDLANYWKALSAQHNPKLKQYVLSEQKLKCKLIISAESLAEDAKVSTPAEADGTLETVAAATGGASDSAASEAPSTTDVKENSKQYDELLEHSVDTTSRHEVLKEEHRKLLERFAQASAGKEALQREVEELRSQLSKALSSSTELRQRAGKGTAEVPERKVAVAESSGSSVHLWQVALIALVCFILGHMAK